MAKVFASALVLAFASLSLVSAQWLNFPTPGIPRTADGRPDLAASTPRTRDGRPDLSGLWTGRPVLFAVPQEALTPWARALIREREENYHKDRPGFRCLPYGPEAIAGYRRIVQTPSLFLVQYENLTSRTFFMDGRQPESNPEPSWMGYSVGRWDGDTLVVESVGFNDRTWLDARGLPHTEALRMTERYRRLNVGQMRVEVTVTDSGAFKGLWTATYDLSLAADTEMLENVCEDDQSHWVGRLSEVEREAVTVSVTTLGRYVGVYSGLWGTRTRTVRVRLENGTLHANGVLEESVRLIPHSDTLFAGTDGLWYEFDGAANPAAFMLEWHVSDNWRYTRQPEANAPLPK